LRAGDLWETKIEKELSVCDILIPILSDDFIQSDFCNKVEIARILERKRHGQDVLITPFYFRYCQWSLIPWIKERDIRPGPEQPFQSIESAHLRTKAIINFRSEIMAQSTLLKSGAVD
jgi:hypothetical protein